MAVVYSPEQWTEAYRLYTEELRTYVQVSEATGIGYHRLVQRAAEQGWATDQKIARARKEDRGKREGAAVDALLDQLIQEKDPRARAQIAHAYRAVRELHEGAQVPRGKRREIVMEFLQSLLQWLHEHCPAAIAALAPIKARLMVWVEEGVA